MVLSATSYGLVPAFARMAYDAGSTPLTLLAVRYVVVTVALLAVLAGARRPLLLPPSRRFAGIITGFLFAVISYCYLGAVRYIPVSFVVLLFFTYPFPVIIIARLRGELLGARRTIAALAAFSGLALALGTKVGDLDAVGVFLALMGSASYTVALFYSGRATRDADPVVVNLHAMATCAVLFVPISLATGEFVEPATALGWIGTTGVVATYFVGVLAFFMALPRVGPMRVAFLGQLEPVVTILSAVIVLKEQLAPIQGLGIALLLAALIALAR
jgi:drug/metabolite transporter (DMT)-like permease